MRQVTQAEFFHALRSQPLDIMPTAKGRNDEGQLESEWRENGKPWSKLWGTSDSDGSGNDRYFLAD